MFQTFTKFGIFDTIDKTWAYNNRGPILFDRQDVAVLASKSINLELKSKSRFFPKEFPNDGLVELGRNLE